MGKGTHFLGQPILNQLLNYFNKQNILQVSRESGGERYEIQVWMTLIANLLITLLQKGVSRSWSFSGLATIVRIMLMYYIDVQGFLEHPEKDWEKALAAMIDSPPNTVDAEK